MSRPIQQREATPVRPEASGRCSPPLLLRPTAAGFTLGRDAVAYGSEAGEENGWVASTTNMTND
jgi:hypothetical protein